MIKVSASDVSSIKSVIESAVDSDEYTMGLATGFINKEEMSDNIIDIVGMIEAGMFTTISVNEEEQRKYRCNPYKLSYEVYGSTDYGATLLFINNMSHPGEFTLDSPIKILNANNIKFIKEMYKELLKKI